MDEKPKGTDDFLKDLQYLMLMMAFEDAFDKQWVQLLIRCKYQLLLYEFSIRELQISCPELL